MTAVIWHEEASSQLERHLLYAKEEFGAATVRRWLKQIDDIVNSLRKYPVSYTPVRELKDCELLYRGCTVMQNFKLIYYYDELIDTVFIEQIWDMRRNPAKLVKLFKR
ncbi:MAG: type II toxin-antitoxin system RelE/ParE family toxin [Prevotella sp.]|nr:type II toxin-antitoxin system RelE/ParE family toxin [Prevotella sp.]